ncbi:MAG TPA: ubiquinone biosynthesis protein [Piscirickettsiaceae bacterium]|nr:ubiquinone biosynthesis protein [Piscirickettsiaceae bacterium]
MKVDLMICGGGPVGLTLALGAARLGLQVALIERSAPLEPAAEQGSFDGRMLALNLGSQQLLSALGIWSVLAPKTTAIEHVHVSQQGHLGVVTLHADQLGVPALGYSVLGRDLGQVLQQLVQAESRIQVFQPARLSAFEQDDQGVAALIHTETGEQRLRGRLLVGADGTQSTVRSLLGWPLQEKDYHSYAILAQVETWYPHKGWSFERFTAEGPVALLPFGTHQHKAVYVCPATQLDRLMALDDASWLAAFTRKMGPRFGGFRATSPRLAYPLKEAYVPRVATGRVALLGNASHTQHPVAAQGLNLGLRDVADYLAGLETAQALDQPDWLEAFEAKRQADHQAVMGMTDSLVSLFQLPQPLAGHLRGLGLMALEVMPRLKRRLAHFSMGLQG